MSEYVYIKIDDNDDNDDAKDVVYPDRGIKWRISCEKCYSHKIPCNEAETQMKCERIVKYEARRRAGMKLNKRIYPETQLNSEYIQCSFLWDAKCARSGKIN